MAGAGDHIARPLVIVERAELREVLAAESDRVAALPMVRGRDQPLSALQRSGHRRQRLLPYPRHVGESDQHGVGAGHRADAAREAGAHAVTGVAADNHASADVGELPRKRVVAGPHHSDDVGYRSDQVRARARANADAIVELGQ